MRPATACGSAIIDYLGAVAAVGLLMLALVAVREHQPHRRPPLNPVGRIVEVLGPPPPPRVRAVPPVANRPAQPRPRRAPRPRATVLAPVWAIDW